MSSAYLACLFLLCRGVASSKYPSSAPRTLLQDSGSYPSSFMSNQSKVNQYDQASSAYHNGSSYFRSSSIALNLTGLPPPNSSLLWQPQTSDSSYIPPKMINVACNYFAASEWLRFTDPFANFSQYCVLWNRSCPGNQSQAIEKMRSTYNLLSEYGWYCFRNPNCQCSIDGQPVPTAWTSYILEVLAYLRSPQCSSVFSENTCCGGRCNFDTTNVELYYWPAADTNIACLSIVGNSLNPFDYGATTTTTNFFNKSTTTSTYWGCTSVLRLSQPPFVSSFIVMTAAMTTTNGFTFKRSFYSPWAKHGPCSDTLLSNSTVTTNSSLSAALAIRARSLIATNSERLNGDPPSSVITLDGYTFTSPSIYVKFTKLRAVDNCGFVGSAQLSSSTMVAFDPGELSTFLGPDWTPISTSVLNVADLPCPPQNVMEANWYKPAPGEPYIPRLAFPTKLQALDPLWATCMGDWFVAYDPPRTLVPVSAMTPTTTVDPPSTSGGTHGVGWSSPTPAPVSTPKLHQPEETAAPLFDPGIGIGFLDPQRPGDGSSHGGGATGAPDVVQPEAIDPKSGGSPDGGVRQSHSSGGSPFIIDIAGAAITFLPHVIAIGSAILAQGDPPTTIAGTVISLGPTAVVVGSNTIPLPFSQHAITTVAGASMRFLPNAVMIAGKILAPDTPPMTVSGMILSVNPSALMIAPKSLPLPLSERVTTPVAGQTATLLPHAVAIADHTMMPGGTAFTLSGLVMTVGISSLLVYAQAIPFTHIQTTVLSTMSGPKDTRISTEIVSISTASDSNSIHDGTMLMLGGDGGTIDGSTVSVSSNGRLIIGGHTLSSPGAGMVFDGTRVSIASDGNMVVDGKTLLPGTQITTASDGKTAVNSQTLQPTTRISSASNGNAVVNSQTLQPDTPISTALDDNIVLNSQTPPPGPTRPSITNLPTSLASAADPVIDQTATKPTTPLDRPTPDSALLNQGSTVRHQSGGVPINETPTSVAHNGKPILNTPGSLPPSTEPSSDLGALIIGAFGGSPTVSSPIVGSSSTVAFVGTLSHESAAVPINEILKSKANPILNTTGTSPSSPPTSATTPPASSSDLGALIIGGFGGGPTGSSSIVSSPSIAAFEGAAGRVVFKLAVVKLYIVLVVAVYWIR